MIKTTTDNNLLNTINKDYNYCSWINNISSCLMKNKVEEIFKNCLNKAESNRCIELFRKELRNISNYRISDIEPYRDKLLEYANNWCGTPDIANSFITSITDNSFYKYFAVKYIGNKRIKRQEGYTFPNNIIFDFNFSNFIRLTGIIEDMYQYEIAYRHYFMLIYILNIIEVLGITIKQASKNLYNKFFAILNDNINSTVLTGMEVFAEFDLGYPYVLLFDELKQLTPESRLKFAYTVTPENLSITFKIKEYSIITRKFAKYLGNAPTDDDIGEVIKTHKGLHKIKYSEVIHIFADKEFDTATFSELRIVQGLTPDRMKVLVKLSGQRIINRLFSINGNVNRNVKTFKLQEYIYMSDNFVAFTLWVVLNATKECSNNFKDIKPSGLFRTHRGHHTEFCELINQHI